MTKHNTLTITVQGGAVTEVEGLPDGWSYEIDDKDQPCCDRCDRSESLGCRMMIVFSKEHDQHRLVCEDCLRLSDVGAVARVHRGGLNGLRVFLDFDSAGTAGTFYRLMGGQEGEA